MTTPRTDLDTPWKETLSQFLADAVALFLPRLHAEVDWSQQIDFLDKELQQISPESAIGRRAVDLLVRLPLHGGGDAWLLLHVEVQSQRDTEFAKRMFGYHTRLLDRFDRDVISVAILTDGVARWRPERYDRGRPESRVSFRYTVVKLLEWREREGELAASNNPFAMVVRAHLAALATRNRPARRIGPKLELVRELYRRGYSQEEVVGLFRFIDWVLRLPEKQDQDFWRQIQAEEEERRMPYVTSVERIGRARGLEEGRQEGLRLSLVAMLAVRFGKAAAMELAELPAVVDEETIARVATLAIEGASIDVVRSALAAPTDTGRS